MLSRMLASVAGGRTHAPTSPPFYYHPSVDECTKWASSSPDDDEMLWYLYFALVKGRTPAQQGDVFSLFCRGLAQKGPSVDAVDRIVKVFGDGKGTLEELAVAAGIHGLHALMERALTAIDDEEYEAWTPPENRKMVADPIPWFCMVLNKTTHYMIHSPMMEILKEVAPESTHTLIDRIFAVGDSDVALHAMMAFIAHVASHKFDSTLVHLKGLPMFHHIIATTSKISLAPHFQVWDGPHIDPQAPLKACIRYVSDRPALDHTMLVKARWNDDVDVACLIHEGGPLCGDCLEHLAGASRIFREESPAHYYYKLRGLGLSDDMLGEGIRDRIQHYIDVLEDEEVVKRRVMERVGEKSDEEFVEDVVWVFKIYLGGFHPSVVDEKEFVIHPTIRALKYRADLVNSVKDRLSVGEKRIFDVMFKGRTT